MGKLDPIIRLEAGMLEKGWADKREIEALRARVREEIDEAVAWAEATHTPIPRRSLTGYETE